jgi:hypothetical protein
VAAGGFANLLDARPRTFRSNPDTSSIDVGAGDRSTDRQIATPGNLLGVENPLPALSDHGAMTVHYGFNSSGLIASRPARVNKAFNVGCL